MKLCVALDLPDDHANLALVEQLSGLDVWLKIGLRSFIRGGWHFVDEVQRLSNGSPIFLDLKLHDIPNTTADAAEAIADHGIEMFNLHASIGLRAMQTVMTRLTKRQTRPILLAVTALTSFSDDEFAVIYHQPIAQCALEMAQTAHKAGLDGAVCSVYESLAFKRAASKQFLTLTPGIRFAGTDANDQSRVATPAEAKAAHADFIVMGRGIYAAADPRKSALEAISACD
ncbi:orotidine 5'-phosphate decarboxylase [Campylobacterota bacterium]|nr:orotidine 5'-phosphate decarboxylase [Campylobacterota bacterium]